VAGAVAKRCEKIDLPVWKVRRYLEPGPTVLVTAVHRGAHNIMTMGWHTVMEFAPSLLGCVIAETNHSFGLVRRSGECTINLPTTASTDTVVGVGNTTGAEIDSPPPMAVRCFAYAAQPQRLQLDRGKLRIGMIKQSGKRRRRRAFDGLVVGVPRFRASCLTAPHSGCFLRITSRG